jgi:hypothetical protein
LQDINGSRLSLGKAREREYFPRGLLMTINDDNENTTTLVDALYILYVDPFKAIHPPHEVIAYIERLEQCS